MTYDRAQPDGTAYKNIHNEILAYQSTELSAECMAIIRSLSDKLTQQDQPKEQPAAFWLSVFTAFITGSGTISGLILAWRKDRRTAREMELKNIELQNKLNEQKRDN